MAVKGVKMMPLDSEASDGRAEISGVSPYTCMMLVEKHNAYVN